jgi:hypothetical protein
MKINTVRRAFAVMTAIATVSGMAACKGSDRQTGKPAGASPSASASAQPADNGITAKSATEIVKATQDALAHARSVRLKGTSVEDGERVAVDLRIAPNACDGSIKLPVNGTLVRVYVRCVDGRTYMRSAVMLRALGGTAALTRRVGDRWFYSSKNHSDPFGGITKPADFAKNLKPDGKVSKGRTMAVNGTPAIELRDSSKEVLYIATTGEPYPIRLAPDSPKHGEGVDLLEYNMPLEVVAPPGAVDMDHPTG